MLLKKTSARKRETCHGSKQSKKRLTLLLCMNTDGSDEQDPLVIHPQECKVMVLQSF